ncbi:hypothetical protein O181_030448 [Austropuccinia psidii MF-1]|uniref:Uncharacterized protein n=1 Tax=Austropuccinia psidii MF-1 TaxID=1389203 RepID=A0A9Q3H3Q0_9BASI|nr:hypothetical protein [Austropuccinia psidii MF-1]
MPSSRSGASYSPSRTSQKGCRNDYGRSQSVAEGQGSMNQSQADKVCHSEADNTVLPSKRAETATISLCGHVKIQLEGLQQCIEAQIVPDPCRYVEKLHEFLPDCERISGPSQNFQVTQWKKNDAFSSRMEEKQPFTTQSSGKNRTNRKKQKFQY